MSGLFHGCSSLAFLPDITNWKINKIEEVDMSDMFGECISLSHLPDIGKWRNNCFFKMNYVYNDCINGVFDPKSWQTKVCINLIR